MNRMRLRLGLLVLVVLVVGPGLAQARPSSDQAPAATHETGHSAGLMDQAWHWVTSVLLKAGSFIDPAGGGHQPHPATTDGIDAGSFIDPAGNGNS